MHPQLKPHTMASLESTLHTGIPNATVCLQKTTQKQTQKNPDHTATNILQCSVHSHTEGKFAHLVPRLSAVSSSSNDCKTSGREEHTVYMVV